VAQRGRVVLVFIPASDLIDALTDEHRKRVGAGLTPPFRDVGSDLRADTNLRVGSGEPRQATIRGELSAIEGRFEGEGRKGLEGEGRCGRIGHEEASSVDR
jgi:hypothetical protein